MPIAFGASLGSNTNKTTGTTVTLTTGAVVPIGALVVVLWAADNLTATTPTLSSVTDSKGNTYSVIANVASGTATANAGQKAAIAVSKITTALTATDTISAVASSASTVVKVIDAAYFTGATISTRAAATTATGSSTAPTVTYASGLIGDLVIGVVANQNNALPTGDSDTTNGSWGTIGGIASTGGGATANISVFGQYKILTATGSQTYNVTITSGQWSIAAVALKPAIQATAYGNGAGNAIGFVPPRTINSGVPNYMAESFVANRTGAVSNVTMYGLKSGTPTGNLVAKLYAHSGTYGSATSTLSTLLATSTVVSASTVPTSGVNNINFQFPSLPVLTSDTPYFVSFEGMTAQGANEIQVYVDETETTHAGVYLYSSDGTTWTYFAERDVSFLVEISSAVGAKNLKRTATNDGLGTQTAVGVKKKTRTATNSGLGTETAVDLLTAKRTATNAGIGTQTALRTVSRRRSAGDQNSAGGFALYQGRGIAAGNNTTESANTYVGQSFIGNGQTLDTAVLYKVAGAPTSGTMTANIYSHSGTYGTSSIPGSLLATSVSKTAAEVAANNVFHSFTFTGANRITLTQGTYYVVVFRNNTNGTITMSTLPATSRYGVSGNKSYSVNAGGSWSFSAGQDLVCQVTTAQTSTVVKTPVRRTATNGGLGTETAIGIRKKTRTATDSGLGTETVTGLITRKRTVTNTGLGTQTATRLVTDRRTATGSGIGTQTTTQRRGQFSTGLVISFGTQTATGKHTAPRTASGAGTGTETALGVGKIARTATGSGIGFGVSDDQLLHQRSATGSGTSTQTVVKFATYRRTVSSSGTGSSNNSIREKLYRNAQGAGGATTGDSALTRLTAKRVATGSGIGYGVADNQLVHQRAATGEGTGTSVNTLQKLSRRNATGTGTGTSSATGNRISGGLSSRTASGNGTGSSTSSGRHIHKRESFPSLAFGTQTVTYKIHRKRTATASGTSTGAAELNIIRVRRRTATGNGTGTGVTEIQFIHVFKRSVIAVGIGTAEAVRKVSLYRTTVSAGTGVSTANRFLYAFREGTANGTGTEQAIKLRKLSRIVDNIGTGTQTADTFIKYGDSGIASAYWGIRAF